MKVTITKPPPNVKALIYSIPKKSFISRLPPDRSMRPPILSAAAGMGGRAVPVMAVFLGIFHAQMHGGGGEGFRQG